jgi:hypothetical protein
MAILRRPDGEIHCQTFGAGFPVLLFAPADFAPAWTCSPLLVADPRGRESTA